MDYSTKNWGWGFIEEIMHPAFVQVAFLYSIYYTIPRWKIKSVLFFIIIRTLILAALIVLPTLLWIQGDYIHDWSLIKDLLGEILTFIMSIYALKDLKKLIKNNNEN